MNEIRYSPHPAGFYTFTFDGDRVGLGSGPALTVPGLLNIAWLTLPDFDAYEKAGANSADLGTWTADYAEPFIDTCHHELNGIPIGALATMMTAKGFLAYLKAHSDYPNVPGHVKFGARWMSYMEIRANKSADVIVNSSARPPQLRRGPLPKPGAPKFTPQNLVSGKVINLEEWLARMTGKVA